MSRLMVGVVSHNSRRLASTCKQLGNGEDYCNFIMADCLCRAADHDLNIDA